jgi:hypothetical protein
MRNCVLCRATFPVVVLLIVFAVFASACKQEGATNATTTTNTTSVNTNTTATNTNTSTETANGTPIEAREPDKYSATITLKLQSEGNGQTTSLPALAADFIKNGADRRVSFKVPGGEQVVFLDTGGKRYIIAVNRKQYAELTPQSTGFDVPTVMTPGQIINSVKGMSGCTSQGEEQMQGRAATKYRCASKASTGTQAGEVSSETFIYIDKETGLPLHSESDISATGNVQGMKGLKVVTEVSNIKTDVDTSQFAEPQGMSKVSPEQVKQQVDLVLRMASAVLQNIMQNSNAPATSAATPAATASPTASPAR